MRVRDTRVYQSESESESLITSNTIQINKQTIELKDVEQKCKNQTRSTYAEG